MDGRVELLVCGMCIVVETIWSAIGLVVKYLVAIEMPRVRFPDGAFIFCPSINEASFSNRVIHISPYYNARVDDFNSIGTFDLYTTLSLDSILYNRYTCYLRFYILIYERIPRYRRLLQGLASVLYTFFIRYTIIVRFHPAHCHKCVVQLS